MPSVSPLSFKSLGNYLAESFPMDFWAAELGRLDHRSRVLARVLSKRRESAHAVSIELGPNGNFRGFKPGQHVNLTVEVGGRRLTRSYSLTGIPRSDGRLGLTIQRIADGAVSAHMFTKLAVGDVVELSQAFGDLTLAADSTESMVLLAAGSGITPMMSLLRAITVRPEPLSATLVYWARHRSDLCFVDSLRELATRNAKLRVRFALTGDAVIATDELRGRISETQLAQAIPDLAASRVYCCGPSEFVERARSLCEPLARTFDAEAFTPSAPTINNDTGARTVNVLLTRSNRVVQVRSGQALLSELEAQGLNPVSGCRMGICNSCACGKRDGITSNLKHGGLSDQADDNLRLCISGAQSDLTLDL